jgi:hypothetical protein
MMIYHYCAHYQGPAAGQITSIDGILTAQVPIDSMDRYREAKKAISPGNWDVLIIDSLSLLDAANPAAQQEEG